MKRNALQLLATFPLLFAMLTLSAPAHAAQQDKPEPPKIIRKSGGVLQGSATKRVEPAYPPLAKTARVTGAVAVEVTIDEEGKVIAARAVSGHPLLKDAAVNAAREWTFTPTQLSGVPVKVIGTLTLNFHSDPKEVIEQLKQKIAEMPVDPELYDELGRWYAKDREYEQSLESYRQALALKPDYARAWMGIAMTYEAMGRVDNAIDGYKRFVELDPNSGDVFLALRLIASLYFNNQRYQEAVEAFKQAIAKRPDVDLEYVPLAMTYLMLGDKESAMEQYRILKERHSKLAEELLKQINGQQ
jgi:TonB family protein